MAGRGSIARWMVATAMVGLALALARVWVVRYDWTAEYGPSLILAITSSAVAVLAGPRLRRFCLGLAASGLVVAWGYHLVPWDWAHEVRHRLVEPVEVAMFGDRSGVRVADKDVFLYDWVRSTRAGGKIGVVIGPYRPYEEQLALALVQLPLALIGGVLAAFRWRFGRAEVPGGLEGAGS